MKHGVSGIWEGKMMPSILRGATEHNKKLLAQQQENAKLEAAKSLRKDKPHTASSTSESSSHSSTLPAVSRRMVNQSASGVPADLLAKARAVLAKLKTNNEVSEINVNPEAKSEVKPPVVLATVALPYVSKLYCHETLDSPPCSPVKAQPVILSPFSQAKVRARQLGVGLKDECRGMYDQAELESRIEKLAELNARLRRSRQ